MRSHWKHRDKKLARMKAWSALHPYATLDESKKETRRAKWRAWYHANAEKVKADYRRWQKARYAANPEKNLAMQRIFREKNRDKIRASQRQYRLENLERRNRDVREYHRHKRLTDPSYVERQRLNGKLTYQKNKAAITARHKEWFRLHPGAQRHYSHKRRALEKGAAINLESIKAWMQSVKSKPFAKCYYCRAKVPTSTIHFDHMIALKNGGAHSVENLCVSCAVCNLKKGIQRFDEWQKTGQAILGL